MRWIGYFLLALLGIFLLVLMIALFVKIKVEVLVQNQQGWIEVRYLWFKYRMRFDEMLTDSMKEDANRQVKKVKEKTEEKVAVAEVEEKVEVKEKPKVVEVKEAGPKVEKVEKKVIKKKEKVKEKKVKKKFDLGEIKALIHRGKIIFKEAKIVLIRLTARIRIQKLNSDIEFSLNDAMQTGCLLGVLWAVQANVYCFIERYVKKIETYHFDVTSKFNGNSFFLNLSCIVSFRIVDIIIVILLSLKELLTIKKLIKLEEE